MALPLRYNVRNVLVRWRATLATVLGIALLVAVYVLVHALAVGLEQSSANTGDPRNLLVVRKGSPSESASLITRAHLKSIEYADDIARDESGRPLISADVLTLVTLPRRNNGGEANVILRGVSPRGLSLRTQVTLVAGRWFVPGKREVVVSQRLARRFANFNIGDTFKTGPTRFTVVGWFDARQSAFDSEAWLDADETRSVFDREMYSSLLIRPVNAMARDRLAKRIEEDKRLPLRAGLEVDYYKAQTMTAMPIKWLGNFLATAMSIGAIFAAMNTMYSTVGARTREVGTLRVLGYRRRAIVAGFLIEGAFLALIGGLLGCLLALPMNGYATATISFETFGETVFAFRITPGLTARGLVFAVLVGILGSFLPALRAARLPVITALKAV